jgi:hypothetical protein
LRDASAPKKSLAFTISSPNWPRRSFTAASARPELRTSARSAGSCSSSTRSTSSPEATKPGRLPSASFRSSPRPSLIALASSRTQPWKARRVGSSKVETISSICTASCSAERGNISPSPSSGALSLPGVIST